MSEEFWLLAFLRICIWFVMVVIGVTAIWFPDHEPIQGLGWGLLALAAGQIYIYEIYHDYKTENNTLQP